MAVKIDHELFKSLAPRHRNYIPQFEPGSTIQIIDVDYDDLKKWGDKEVPQIILDNNKKVPAPYLLNMVIMKDGIVKNEGTECECVDFLGNTLYDYLEEKYGDEEKILPESITIVKPINKGVLKENITSHIKKRMYKESYYGGEGTEFEKAFKGMEFVPSILKGATNNLRNNKTTLIEAID